MIDADLHKQIVYDLGRLTAQLEAGFKRIDERMDRFHLDFIDQRQVSSRQGERIDALEKWKAALVSKATVVGSLALFAWAIISEPVGLAVRHVLGLQ